MFSPTPRTRDGDALAVACLLEATRKPSDIAIASVSLVRFWSDPVRQKLAHVERCFSTLWNFGGVLYGYGSGEWTLTKSID
jgi:hypothetical protein